MSSSIATDKGTKPGFSLGGDMHSTSEDDKNFPGTTVSLNLHDRFYVF
jgi:hypothetical protein